MVDGSQSGRGSTPVIGVPGGRPSASPVEDAPAPEIRTPVQWLRLNLFSSWANGLLTVVSGVFAAFVIYQTLRFVFVGANWAVVRANMKGYMVGGFPIEEVWRVWASAYLVGALAGLSSGASGWRMRWTVPRVVAAAAAAVVATLIVAGTAQTLLVRALSGGLVAVVAAGMMVGRSRGASWRRPLLVAWISAFPLIIVIVRGFGGVSPSQWEGFFFNLIAATVGIFASFPIGIALALGRRSNLPAMRVVCVAFIELFRGVPLVAWLIFSKYVVDLLLPPQMDLPDIIKAFTAMTLFSSAYVGEIVRGGLQGVPVGQYEAARAMGLSTMSMMVLVVLPQALRTTIPAMISHFISLFKDTSLFTAIEVTDLLAAARRSAESLEFFGQDMETLLFAALLFWVVAFSMSRWSQRLEVRLGVGVR
jgi:general L-amino acid transport system permease protein